MDALDPLILARIQFAANITFHILFPTISISMGWALLYFKTRFTATGHQWHHHELSIWHQLARLHEYRGQRGRATVGL